jgi:ATP-dependent protease HslVU (ClpYQ) peptidase subunit
MTAIVAYSTGKKVMMGSDSRLLATDGSTHSPNISKLFKINNEILVGLSGSSVGTMLLEHGIDFPKLPKKGKFNQLQWLVRNFVLPAKLALEELGYPSKEDIFSITALIGVRGILYELMPDWELAEINKGTFYAVGSGSPYALGAMFSAKNELLLEELAYKDNVQFVLEQGLLAACNFHASCGGPLFFEEL